MLSALVWSRARDDKESFQLEQSQLLPPVFNPLSLTVPSLVCAQWYLQRGEWLCLSQLF